ncbi:MAG: TRAM domain-containing protein [Nitrospirae bacterium]|nr:MAG: TRAM domain-containing protein [Nitrospirota bacterium]
MALRAAFVTGSILVGVLLGMRLGEGTDLLLGGIVGAMVSGGLVWLEQALRSVPLAVTLGGAIGLAGGVVVASLVLVALGQVLHELSLLTGLVVVGLFLVFPYLGFVVGSRMGKEGVKPVSSVVGGVQLKEPPYKAKLLDTSVIIDGRIADLCETGFIEGKLVIPQFILQELQHISDSADSLKRARGRRGLDILNHIQKNVEVEVEIVEDDFPHIKEVDAKLVELAKRLHAKIITNDLNLNKVAELQGVRVLNINDLSNALKPVVLPGETVRVFVLKEGKEAGQGVAYLDDGTMVVVDNAKRCIGKNVDVVVTSVLQTSAGRMIFTRLKEETDRDELSFARG